VTPSSPPTQPLAGDPTTPTPLASARWWNGWHIAFGAFLTAYGAYVIYILGRMSHDPEEAVPRSLNAIVLTALCLGATLSFIAAGRHGQHKRDKREEAWRTAVLAAINEVRTTQTRRPEDEPTVPLVGRAVVYQASVTAAQGTLAADALMRRVNQMVDERVDARVADIRQLVDNEQAAAADGGWPQQSREHRVVPMVSPRR
jgi:hypothetical protein